MDWKTFAYTLYFCYLVWIKSICIRIWLLFWPFLVSSNWTFDNTDFRTEMTKRGHFWGVECQICGRINQWMVDDRVPGGWLVAKWAIWRDPTWSVPGITTNYNSISPDYPRDLLLTRMEGIKTEAKCYDKESGFYGKDEKMDLQDLWRFVARVWRTDGRSIISMLAHLPCLLIERPPFNWINCPVIYNIQRAQTT